MPRGHGFDSFDPTDGSLSRGHQLIIRDFRWTDPEGITVAVSIWISQTEIAAWNDGPVLDWTPVEIVIDGSPDYGMDGAQAREVAAALLDAADTWDAAQSERQG